MIYRYMYAGYANEDTLFSEVPNNKAETLCLCHYNDLYFLYYETKVKNLLPEDVVNGTMRPFPNGNRWFFMPDVFHFSKPQKDEDWARKIKKTPFVRLNRLYPEKTGSYIFYHQQYQEEYPGDYDKYGFIGLFDSYLCYYEENPVEIDDNPPAGKLHTHNSPRDEEWDAVMSTHFHHWDDVEEEWRELPVDLFR